MKFSLPPDYQRFVEQLVGEGGYRSADEVVRDSLDLLRAQAQYRQTRFARLKEDVEAGMKQIRRGEVAPVDPLAILEEVEREFTRAKTKR